MPRSTYWNGEPCEAMKIKVKVGSLPKDQFPQAWWHGLEGTIRNAVIVRYGVQEFLLDNQDGSGWYKVTTGMGSPNVSHNSLPRTSKILGRV